MNSFPINLKILPYVIYLSSKSILTKKLENNGFLTEKELENLVFIEQRNYNYTLPNFIHINHQKYIKQKKKEIVFFNALGEISNYYLEQKDKKIYIKNNLFEEWQILTTLINPIHVVASLLSKKKKIASEIFSSSSILTIEMSDLIKSFFKQTKIFDSHIHLNGTSEVIFNWQYFLNNPRAIYKQLDHSIHFEQIGLKDKKEVIELIEKAKYIQESIVYIVKNKRKEDNILKYEVGHFFKKQDFFPKSEYILHPIQILIEKKLDDPKYNIPTYELLFFVEIIQILEDHTILKQIRSYLRKLAHIYLLIYSQFNKLLIQQYEQHGFDQFQMITDNGVRDFYEDLGYKDRFKQLKGINNITFESIEGRFAPKKDIYKTYKLLNNAIYDYIETTNTYYEKCKSNNIEFKYIQPYKSNQLNNKNKIKKLSLTAHFIKKKNTNCVIESKGKYVNIIKCPRHASLRKELYNQATILINLIKTYKGNYLKLRKIIKHNYFNYINGIDAAGNELYSRPEVFAPTFRHVRKELNRIDKKIGFTFHAGEDFVHIISGIRYIYEAVTFLNMEKKDRIGHATALGINPDMWKTKLNDQLLIKKGEWLDNLIFICKVIDLNESFFPEISLYWKNIYNQEFPTLEKAFAAYELRKYNPDRVFLKNYSYIYKNKAIENLEIKDIYKRYHLDYNTKKEYNRLIPITISKYLSYIEPLQNEVLKFLKRREIAIEVMPSSNTRISFYNKYEEHHIFKWLDKKDIPDLVIATDDPGIFNTNIQNEYLHLYNVLSNRHEKSDEYIYNLFKTLNNNAKKYSFV